MRPRRSRAPIGAATLLLLLMTSAAFGQTRAPRAFQYVSPMPESKMVSPWNNVVIRPGGTLDRASIASDAITVVGSASGRHAGTLSLSTDGRSLVFVPDQPYAFGEQVTVRLARGVRTADGTALEPLAFGFTVSRVDPRRQPRQGLEDLRAELSRMRETEATTGGLARTLALACDTLPPGYPVINVLGTNSPSDGALFMTPFGFTTPGPLVILDNLGNPLFYRKLGTRSALDFSMQPSGLLTYFDAAAIGGSGTNPAEKYFAMDSTYAVVDSFFTGNGYITDLHDVVVLANGHALLMSYDPQPVDMSVVVPGGDPGAIVTGLIVQEIDAAKNVVFQWRSWDHYQITDFVEQTGTLTAATIDYVHGNSVGTTNDGNIIVSARHMNEITKIDRNTGDIIWRLGLNAKNNDFTFVNDTRGFSHQHDARILPNGHLTLFDNGNFLAPAYSRAVEYELDENAMTATQVWEYRNSPDTNGGFMGSVQRLPGGGTLIGWGGTPVAPGMTEVHAFDKEALEIGFNPAIFSYRVRKFPWQTSRFETDLESIDFGQVLVGASSAANLTVRNNTASSVTITCFPSTDPQFVVADAVPIVIGGGSTATVSVEFHPTAAVSASGVLYVRSTGTDEVVAQRVTVTGTGVGTLPAAGTWTLAILGGLILMLAAARLGRRGAETAGA